MKHWNPQSELDRWTAAERIAPRRKPWPAGATAGLALVAVACVGLGLLLYRLAGPSDVFAP